MVNSVEKELRSRIRGKSAKIGILGLGYVGLPLVMEFCRAGFKVTGFDISRERVASINAGKSYVLDVPSSEIKRFRRKKRFEATDRFDLIARQDILLVCVQTPLRKSKEPDISNIIAAMGEVKKRLRPGQLIVLESTTFPGTTDEIVKPLLEKSGLRVGRDFFLAFSPERVDPGNKDWTIANTPKVVGGAEFRSTRLAAELYTQIVDDVVPISSTRAAEVVKLLENSFRAVNIALINEMAQICHKLGLDVWEVIAAAATKPFGFMPFQPGPGIGGHCIPKDPQLLTWKMKTLNFEPRFIQLASAINGAMPEYTVRRIAEVLNLGRKAINGAKILILGAAYKPNISDYRESPSLDVMHLLLDSKAVVSYHDSYVPRLEVSGKKLSSIRLTPSALKAADCVVVLTAHGDVDYRRVARLSRRIFDARNSLRGISGANIHRL